jgi:hypothetical protein
MVSEPPINNEQPMESPKPERRINLVRVLGIVSLVLIVGIAVAMGTFAKSPSSLHAAIQWDGNQFRVSTNDDFQWDDVNLALNSDFKLKVGIIVAHSEFVAPYSQFVKDDGTAFDASTMTPSLFYITAQIPNNQTGSWWYKFP